MAPAQQKNVLVYYNGQCFRQNNSVFFQSNTTRGFRINTRSNFAHLKERISEKLNLGNNKVISEIYWRQPVVFGNSNERFESYKVVDNDDVEYMFATHCQFEALVSIELYVTLEDVHPTDQHQIEAPPFDYTQYYSMLSQDCESQPSSSYLPDLNTQPSSSYHQSHQLEASQFHPQPSSSYHQSHQHEASQFYSQPSSSYHQEGEEEDEDDIVNGVIVGEESENEEEYVAQAFGDVEDEDVDDHPMYNPPPHMLTLDASIDERTEVLRSMNPRLPVDQGIEVGMQFHTKADCVSAIRTYHIKQSRDYKVKQSDKERYVIQCKQPTCKFSLRASERTNGRWVIGVIKNEHTCISLGLTQDHHKLNSTMISESIASLLHKDLSIKVKTIIAHIRDKFNYTVTYRKAWIAKNKAIENMFGSWVDSYHALPQWLMTMQHYLPNVVTILETLPADTPDDVTFHRLFWSFEPLIKGFAYCKPIVQVDGTWLYGKYKGTLLLAVAQDGNDHIFPVAFAIVEGETKEAWNFFLKNLRTYVTPQQHLCVISDRHPSIKSAYDNPANGWNDPTCRHVYCIRHIAQNFMRKFNNKKLRKLVVNMGFAVNQPLHRYYRSKIAAQNTNAIGWLDNIPIAKWTQAFDEGRRWGHMTTNLAESMNNVFKGIRNEPITALVQSTFYKCVVLFQRRATESAAVLQSGQQYSEACQKRIKEAMHKANSHQVIAFDRLNQTFRVMETVNHNEGRPMGRFLLKLGESCCDCGEFQALHLPCSHVIAACSHAAQAYQVHIHDVYKAASVFCVYNNTFPGIQDQSYWPQYYGRRLCPDPAMKRCKRGRPKSTRIRTEMDDEIETLNKCALCRVPGHDRRNCPNSN
ncbi:unnamed protein product [Trifolium pratense]|uniref:Uncharacterized protein n=1 Tax=Trifolium pratense TaxID=57577 RepID=A0ACB0JT94_TRIPR|nr:unnamed protein product [Trifolium pratense]